MDRRSFLTWAGLGALATSLPIALAACSTDGNNAADTTTTGETAPPETEAATTNADSFVAVGTTSTLESNGSISDSKFAGGSGKLIVVKDGENIVALDAKCPHAGCAVDWKDDQLICPCHNSKFATNGSLINGPATEGLASFEAKVEGDQILVKTS